MLKLAAFGTLLGLALLVAQAPGGSFPGRSGRLFTVKPDGSGMRALKAVGDNASFSPDGEQLSFGRTLSTEEIFIARKDGSQKHRILTNAINAAWSPDGSTLAVVRLDWTVEFVTTRGRRFDGPAPKVVVRSVAWSPDGSRLAFDTRQRTGPGALFVVRVDQDNAVASSVSLRGRMSTGRSGRRTGAGLRSPRSKAAVVRRAEGRRTSGWSTSTDLTSAGSRKDSGLPGRRTAAGSHSAETAESRFFDCATARFRALQRTAWLPRSTGNQSALDEAAPVTIDCKRLLARTSSVAWRVTTCSGAGSGTTDSSAREETTRSSPRTDVSTSSAAARDSIPSSPIAATLSAAIASA